MSQKLDPEEWFAKSFEEACSVGGVRPKRAQKKAEATKPQSESKKKPPADDATKHNKWWWCGGLS